MSPTPPDAPLFRHLEHWLNDPDEFGGAVSGGHLVAEFLLPRRGTTVVEQFQSREWAMDFHEAQVKARILGAPPPGWGAVALLRGQAPSQWYGKEAGRGTLVCTPPGVPIDGRFIPGFQCFSLGVPPGVWEKCRALAGAGRARLGSGSVHHLPAPRLAGIERRLELVRQALRAAVHSPLLAPIATEAASDFAEEMITLAWELPSADSQPVRLAWINRARLARRAEQWMRDHLSDPIRIPDLCLALRVSRREMEYAFRQTFDQSPRDYLQTLRLNAVRRALRRSDGLPGHVSQIAAEHGITHFGRFAALYRALFGENPAASFRRS